MANKAEIDCYDVQVHYGGIAGWETVTAEETYEDAKAARDVYRANDPVALDFRIQRVYKSGFRVTIV